ncbi:MAG TPA: ribonuclease HI family protein [Candidatus Paceibacterota bacterium]|nr:ribonuclease HI family protein [Candidatus Paceibacterota bacterium]
MSDTILIYTDGGARNNPGPAGAGAVIMEGDRVVSELKQFLGEKQTNNWAEYEAVYIALIEAKRLHYEDRTIEVRLDSKLIAEQLSGNWKIKEPSLKLQWAKVRALIRASFPHIAFVYIPREKNVEADRLVNEAIDEAGY